MKRKQCRNVHVISVSVAAAVLGLGIQSATGEEATPPPAPPRPESRAPEAARTAPHADALSGTITSFNLNAHGDPDSLLIKDGSGKTLQVNFPPPVGVEVQQAAPVGDSVTVNAVPTRSMPDHPVYNLVSLKGAKGKDVHVPQPGERKTAHAEGIVKNLNYNHEGHADGVVLDSGDFILIGPETDRMKLKEGEKVAADGTTVPMPAGHSVIRASTVNGQQIQQPPPRPPGGPEGEPPDHGPRDHRHRGDGPGAEGPGRGGPGSPDQGRGGPHGYNADGPGNSGGDEPQDGPPPRGPRGQHQGRDQAPPPPPGPGDHGHGPDGGTPPAPPDQQ